VLLNKEADSALEHSLLEVINKLNV